MVPQVSDRLTGDPETDQYNYHHGQLNSRQATSPYLGGRFKIVRFRDLALV